MADAARPLTPTQLDAQLRADLRGRRLVCEVAWDDDRWQAIYLTSSSLLGGAKDPSSFGADWPALLVAYLVEVGGRKYDENEFWPATAIPQARRQRAGVAFEDALTRLGLERFPQFFVPGAESARRFVSVILAHGGMPRSLAEPFIADVLIPALRRGAGTTGEELVAAWRADPPAVPRTVERFLLHGGATTVDLIDRLIAALTVDPAELRHDAHGLPLHLRDAVLAVPVVDRARLTGALPRPRIELDPYSSAGPQIVLPALDREIASNVAWSIDTGHGQVRRRGRSTSEERVPLVPAAWWRVSALRTEGAPSELQIAPLNLVRECFGESPAVCFDGSTGGYLADVGGLRADDVWFVCAPGVEVAIPEGDGLRELPAAEVAATLSGPWLGHRMARYDISGLETVVLRRDGQEIGRIPVTHEARPEILGERVRDVTGLAAGEPVFAAPPELRLPAWGVWSVTVTELDHAGEVINRYEETVDASDAARTILVSGEQDSLARYEVAARGPIGSDLRTIVAVVPRLAVDTPLEPVMPGDRRPEVTASAHPSLALAGRPAGDPATVEIDPVGTTGQLWVWRGRDRKIGLLVRAPLVRWAVRHANDLPPALAATRVSLEPADLRPGDAIVLETGRRGRLAGLELRGAGGATLQEGEMRGGREHGRQEVSLDRFLDTWRANPDAEMVLRLDGRTVSIAGRPVDRVVPPRPPVTTPAGLRRGDPVRGRVRHVGPGWLDIEVDGHHGRAFPERIHGAIVDYRVDQEVDGVVCAEPPDLKFDLRPFDSTRWTRGAAVTARVVRVSDASVHFVVDESMDAIAGIGDLAPRTRAADLRLGTTVDAVVLRCEADNRRWRLSLAPVPPETFVPGAAVAGTVRGASGGRLFLDLDTASGVVESVDLPPGRPPGSFSLGERVDGHVLNRDTGARTVWCTLRAFNDHDLVIGAEVSGRVQRTNHGGVAVRLDDGTPAFAPLRFLPADTAERHQTAYRRDDRVTGRVMRLEPEHFRVTLSLAPEGATYSFGPDGPDTSPFAVLRDD